VKRAETCQQAVEQVMTEFLMTQNLEQRSPMRTFTDTENRILKLVQGTLPDCTTPFAAVADIVSAQLREEQGADAPRVREQDVLDLIAELKTQGAIRRFGATLRHQKAGYGGNVMVAWKCPEVDIDACGTMMAEHRQVSHCYYRLGASDWPFVLYTMVHGRDTDECLAVVQDLKQITGLDDPETLFSVRELKKTSMTYF
jgi:siroheme decarboxylase